MSRDRIIAAALSGVAIVTVICGLWLGGNPISARKERRDSERSMQLSQTASLLHTTYTERLTLPTSTEAYLDLRAKNPNGLAMASISEVPDYRWLNSDTYELCMTFETASNRPLSGLTRPALTPEESPDFWAHAAGRTCYLSRLPSWVMQDAATRASSTRPKP